MATFTANFKGNGIVDITYGWRPKLAKALQTENGIDITTENYVTLTTEN
jgi:hypothetical protein